MVYHQKQNSVPYQPKTTHYHELCKPNETNTNTHTRTHIRTHTHIRTRAHNYVLYTLFTLKCVLVKYQEVVDLDFLPLMFRQRSSDAGRSQLRTARSADDDVWCQSAGARTRRSRSVAVQDVGSSRNHGKRLRRLLISDTPKKANRKTKNPLV